MSRQQYLTVNALTKYIKRKFDADPHLQNLYVKGEISNFKQHSSGHMYFTLKDENSRILAVMFSRANRNLTFTPENGMKVLLRGDVTVYDKSGQYQIYVNDMQPDGIGALYLSYKQLKEKLAKEGLFLDEHKKALPKMPKKIGIVTSPTGAAVRDIITTIQRRFPICDLILFPALVQGDQAGKSIESAINKAHEIDDDIQLLIVGRGGGSIEELWAFNEERVARAIFASEIPIISAVGHETDFTIADLVADLRAPTPTAAAELAVPSIDDLLEKIMSNKQRITRIMKKQLDVSRERLNIIERSYGFRYPKQLYEQKLEQVDKLTEQLVRLSKYSFQQNVKKLNEINRRLDHANPRELVNISGEKLTRLTQSLNNTTQHILLHKQKDFQLLLSTLEALNPLKIMDRGYSVTYDDAGNIIKTISNVKKSDRIDVHLSDGKLKCEVINVEDGEKNGN